MQLKPSYDDTRILLVTISQPNCALKEKEKTLNIFFYFMIINKFIETAFINLFPNNHICKQIIIIICKQIIIPSSKIFKKKQKETK